MLSVKTAKFTFLKNLYEYGNLSLLSKRLNCYRRLNRYRRLLNYVLQALVNKRVNMVKQLYYSEIHSKNIEIYLSKLYKGAVQIQPNKLVTAALQLY